MILRALLSASAICYLAVGPNAGAQVVKMEAGGVTFSVDPTTLSITATSAGSAGILVMPPLYSSEANAPIKIDTGWRWSTKDGQIFVLGVENQELRLRIVGKPGSKVGWSLPATTSGDWLVPDGEGIAMSVADPFWRAAYRKARCLDASSALSFPAWSFNETNKAIIYALGDGLQSKLCFHDRDGVQAKLLHNFSSGGETLELLIAIRPNQPLAPALFYRQLLKERNQFKSFSDKTVSGLPRLFAAPQAYIWGDGRSLGFLNDLSALGIRRIVLSYDQDARRRQHLVGPTYLRRARALGYLAGPYEEFDNGQPKARCRHSDVDLGRPLSIGLHQEGQWRNPTS